MAKFSGRPVAKPSGPMRTTTKTKTHEGGAGWERDPESALFTLAATNMVSEGTFYESADDRDERFVQLVGAVTRANPAWISGSMVGEERDEGKIGFASYLRDVLQMRSASLVMAAEYVKAGGPHGRFVVASALQRADEPAEILGYWMSQYGRKLPAPLKRGVADAVRRLYTERAALRYDGLARTIRMADVIELVHPAPRADWQNALFKYLLDKRHHPDTATAEGLPTIQADERLRAIPEKGRRVALREGLVAEAGWSWERLGGWLPGGMDAEAWEAVIPQMGYMALIRNLRNFDGAGISTAVQKAVCERIADPEEVARSRQFPYRFYSAYKNAPNVRWAPALEDALDYSCRNIPELPGRTLILIDTSGSMSSPVSNKSAVQRYEIAALFAAAMAKRVKDPDVVIFGDSSKSFPLKKGESVLRYIERVHRANGSVGHGTMIWEAAKRHYDGHDRIVIFTDEQTMDSQGNPTRGYYGRQDYDISAVPMIHAFNLAGYKSAMMESGRGRYTYAGFTDATFTVMALLEQGFDAGWPFA